MLKEEQKKKTTTKRVSYEFQSTQTPTLILLLTGFVIEAGEIHSINIQCFSVVNMNWQKKVTSKCIQWIKHVYVITVPHMKY